MMNLGRFAFIALNFLFLSLFFSVSETFACNLRVSLFPVEAVNDGAKWKISGQDRWYGSGDTVFALSSCTINVEFLSVPGWFTPATRAVTIAPGTTEDLRATYSQATTGRLTVTIEPESARHAGARWRLAKPAADVPSPTWPWRRSGDTEIDIPVGDYLVEFEEVEGWLRPDNLVVPILAGAWIRETGTYRPQPDQGGGIQVIIEPREAREAGGRWRVVGTSDWQESGATLRGLSPGSQTIEYASISGWRSPDPETVLVVAGRTYAGVGTYTPRPPAPSGSLHISLSPPAAVAAGAGWRLAGLIPRDENGDYIGWYTADRTTIDGLTPGDYTLIFQETPGWLTPLNNQTTITIAAGQTTFVQGVYALNMEKGGLNVDILPEAARQYGARWRRTGTHVWRESGRGEDGLPEGTYTVEFKPISCGTVPGNQAVYVQRSHQSRISGEYRFDTACDVFTQSQWITALYVAYWGRAADPSGKTYWTNLVNQGVLSISSVAENFALSDEAKSYYPYLRIPHQATHQDRVVFVQSIYRNLLNREAEKDGLDYWVGVLHDGISTPGMLIGNLIYAAMQQYNQDWTTIRNKVYVADYFTKSLIELNKPWKQEYHAMHHSVIGRVSHEQSSINNATSIFDSVLN